MAPCRAWAHTPAGESPMKVTSLPSPPAGTPRKTTPPDGTTPKTPHRGECSIALSLACIRGARTRGVFLFGFFRFTFADTFLCGGLFRRLFGSFDVLKAPRTRKVELPDKT